MKRILPFVLMVALVPTLWGLSFEPLSQDFATSGRNSIRTFRVTNTQDQPIAVRVRMMTRDITTEGKELQEDASHLFLVFPAQLVLQPGNSQAVRVQWRGGEFQGSERAFRIVAEQMPVQTQASAGGLNIKFTYRYEGSVYVAPPETREPEIVLSRIVPLPSGEGPGYTLLLRFENLGGRHAIIRDPYVSLSVDDTDGSSTTITFDKTSLDVLNGVNLLAGNVLYQSVRVPESWKPIIDNSSQIQTSFSLEMVR